MCNSLRRPDGSAFRVRVVQFFALMLLLLLAGELGQAQAAIALVQHTGRDAGVATTSTLAFVSPNTAGNWIAVYVRGGGSSSQVFTIADSNGNTYRRAFQLGVTANPITLAVFYAENIKGGANTVTVSDTVSGPLRFAIVEYSGVATSNSLDVPAAVAQGSGTSPNSGNLTTTASGDLLLAAIVTNGIETFTAGSGYTIEQFVPAEPNTKLIAEDQIQLAAGTVSASATLGASDTWGAGLAAFKPVGGVAGVPATITATAGTPQSATVGTAFATQFQATVKDSFNNPVNGATITFAAPGSGASGTFAGGTVTATTNASGVATAAVFTGNNTAGAYTVTASVSGVSTPANFSLTNLAGSAAAIAATAGTPQNATVNTAFAVQFQATVKDSFGNPVNNVTVTFAAPGSGASGTFAGGTVTATTNASGVATAAVFTANTTAGAYTVTASVSGVGTSANFSLTNVAGAAATITATAGTPQSATVNTAFAVQFQATVKDSFGNPVNNVTVTFTAPGSGASGTFANGVKTATTNSSGVATAVVFTANTVAGAYTVTASVSGVGTSASFSLTNLAGAAASIAATAGTPQSATINTAFATQFQATVKDSFGNPVGSVAVTFTAPGSGASGTFAGGNNAATTNASGVATAAVFTANGTTGSYTVTASASGVGTSANFSLTNLGNPPANIAATAGTPQSATINTAFAAQLQVTVTDSSNNPVSGATVTFAAPGSGASGTFAGANTAVTNASGVATSAVFTANSIAGSYTVTATVSGVAASANFSLTNLTGPAASITATAGTPQSATVGSAYATQFQAIVKDAGGNPVNGVTVTFAAPGSGASGTFAGGATTAITNSSGVATAVVFTANNTAGAYIVTASVSGVGTQANFSLTNLAGAAASIAANAGTPQSATVNTAFTTQLQATVTDSFNNPLSGVTVTFTAPASGASGTFAGGNNTAMTNASGVATAAVFTANSVAGGPYTVTASVSAVGTSASFSLTNTASVAAKITLVQHTGKDAGVTASTSLAFSANNTAGNWIAVCIRAGSSSSQVFTVTDSIGNTYQRAFQLGVTADPITLAVFYAENIKGGANTVTVSDTVSGPLRFAIVEYSGVATSNSLDVPAAVAQGSGTSPNSGNLTTTASGDLLLAAFVTNATETFTAGSGYTIEQFVPAEPNTKLIAEDQIQLAAGTASASATLGASDNWGAGLAAFKAASGGGGAGVPTSITATAGTPQSATVNTAFVLQLQATVKDSLNNPVGGVSVTFAAPGSGASGTFAGGVTTATTNASGIATAAVFTANTVAGAYAVTASVSGVSTPANFSLTNLAGSAASIAATAGTPQSASINAAFATQLQATIKDSFSNPVSGVTVTFTAPGSGASGTFAGGVNTATTNSSGVAIAAVFTANGTTGSYTVTAAVSGVGTTANFSLTNLAAPPASITATAGTPQSATVNTAFTTAFQVTAKDASNNPVSGVTVTFTAPGSGASGTFAGGVTTATTNSSGIATAAVFTANGVAGTYTLTATVSGVATPANFSLTNLAGPAAKVTVTSGSGQSAAINTAFPAPLVATVVDASNNPVSGVVVTFTAPGSGASGTFGNGTVTTTATTNGSGVATSTTFTANATTGGPYNVVASATGTTSANFSLTNLANAPPSIALVQHTSRDAGVATTSSLAFVSPNTAGNWIAVCIRAGGSNAEVFTVTDSNGNTYHQAFQLGLTGSGLTFAIYYAEDIFGGVNTITVSNTVSGPLRFAILEYSGVATSNSLDAFAAVAQGTSTSPNSGTLNTTANGDLLLAAVVSTNSATFTAVGGYTIEAFVPAEPNTKLISEDILQNAAGPASASATLAASDIWGAGLIAVRSASGVPLPISVSVSPTSASIPTGYGTQTFTASLANDFQHKGVTWSLSGAGCSGSTCGFLSSVTNLSATYTGPANVPSPATVTLTATSVADNTKTASATITVTQGVLNVAVTPKRAAVTMSASQTVQFTATVTNDPANAGATWQVDGNNGGNTTTGTVSTTGLYTPGTQPGQHTVTAVSNSNASVSDSSTVAVTDLAGVYTHHNDNARTGQNLKEYELTPANVQSPAFGLLFSCPVDGFLYATPLWVANLTVGGVTRNVVFLATEHNSVYAFDADSLSCIQLWHVNFLGTGVTTIHPADLNGNMDLVPEIGITSTPVIDPATNTIYVVPKTKETVGTVNGQACSSTTPCFVHRLHALDLLTGAEKFGGPVVISASGFTPLRQMQRPALLLANNTVYIAFGSHGDQNPYQGWLMGYDPATLAQKFATAFADTNPTLVTRAGIWGGGAGPSTDASGYVYVSTGNGVFDAFKGGVNYGDTVAKVTPGGAIFATFTPYNQQTFDSADIDLGSGGVLILPDVVGSAAHPHLALATGKVGILYLLDQNNLGGYTGPPNNDVQEVIPTPPINLTHADGGNYGYPAYWNDGQHGNIYSTGDSFPLSQFQIPNGTGLMSTPQIHQSGNMFAPRGAIPSVSANGTTSGIVWILDLSGWSTNGPAILDAYDATNVSTLLFSSPINGSGAASPAVKFTLPVVANGKVYVGGELSFSVFGLSPN